MASTPAFIAIPRIELASVSAANTAIDGSGIITPLISGGATGTRVLEIDVKLAATSAAAVVNIFLSTDSGTTWKLFDAVAVTAITVSNVLTGFRGVLMYDALVLPSAAARLGFATTIAQATNVVVLGGDL